MPHLLGKCKFGNCNIDPNYLHKVKEEFPLKQEKKDHLNKLTGAIEAMALYKKHVDPNCTDRDFVFNDEDNTTVPDPTVGDS